MTGTPETARLLRKLREERGRSLRSVASDLGVAPSHLSRLERGEKAASEELIHRTARYYGLDDDILALSSGRVPADIVSILKEHPALMNELRSRFGQPESE